VFYGSIVFEPSALSHDFSHFILSTRETEKKKKEKKRNGTIVKNGDEKNLNRRKN